MAINYDAFPCPDAVRSRINVLATIEATLTVHADDMALAVSDDMDTAGILAGAISAEETPYGAFPETAVSLVSMTGGTGPKWAVTVHSQAVRGFMNQTQSYDCLPDSSVLQELTNHNATIDSYVRILLEASTFTAERSNTMMDVLLRQPTVLGPILAERIRGFSSERGITVVPPPPERPRVLTRRRPSRR